MTKRRSLTAVFAGMLVATVVIVGALVVGPSGPVAVGIGAVVGLAVFALVVAAGARRPGDLAEQEESIRRDGILGRGIVLAAAPTGRKRGDRDEIDVRLEVQLPMRRRFEARRRDWLGPADRQRVIVGGPVPVAADPNEPGHVVLVLDIPDVDPAAIAGLGPVAGGPGGPPRGARPVRPTRDEPGGDR